jgi:lysozyme family protein
VTAYFKNKVIPFLWEHEGTAYEDDPDDPGNTGSKYRGTKYGIDARSHPNVDIKNLTSEQATDIYWSEWIKDGCEHLPVPLDWLFFDACVNCGVGRAQQFLTESAKNPKKFQQERIDFYNRLADQKPRLAKFRKGWISRVIDLSKVAGVV